MPDAHLNFAASLVATAPSPATSGGSLVVTTGEGGVFPATPFNATVYPAGSTPTGSNAEIVRVTARTSDTLTISRAQEGTTAKSIAVGWVIEATITRKTLEDAEGVNPILMRSATDAPQQVRQSAAGTAADIFEWLDQGGSVVTAIGPLGQFLRGGRDLAYLTSRLTTAGTNSTVTYTASGLSITLLPNKVYKFKAHGIYRTAATTTGYGLRINFSGTTTSIQYQTTIWNASTPTKAISIANQGALLTTAVTALNTDYAWDIEGLIVVGASGGNLVVEHASEVGSSLATMGINSLLEAREVA